MRLMDDDNFTVCCPELRMEQYGVDDKFKAKQKITCSKSNNMSKKCVVDTYCIGGSFKHCHIYVKVNGGNNDKTAKD